jgi:hypothetical protein
MENLVEWMEINPVRGSVGSRGRARPDIAGIPGRHPVREPRKRPTTREETVTVPYFGIHVECYAGYRGEEEPRRFTFESRRVEVAEILDRWLDPSHRYFKVRGNDEGIYMLRHDAGTGMWELSVFREGSGHATE